MKAIIAVLIMFIAGAVFAQQNTLDSFRQAYEKQQQILLAQYGTTIDTIIADLKKKGDLDNILILQAERKRLDVDKTIPTPADAKDLFRPAAKSYYQAMATLLTQYVKALDGLIKKEVTADRIEAAKVIKTEKDKADFMLADIQSKLPAKEKLHTNAVTEEPTATTTIPKGTTPQFKKEREFKLGNDQIMLFPDIITFHTDGTISGKRGTLVDNMHTWKEKKTGDISVLGVGGKEWRLFKKNKNDKTDKFFRSTDWYLLEQ